MKRTAVSLFVWCAICAWAAAGHAKKGGGGAKQPAAEAPAEAADDKPAAAPAAEKADAPAGDDQAAAPTESLDDDPTKGTKVDEGSETAKPVKVTTASWSDIVVVPRKPFLKGSRFEFAPFSGLSINDNLIRHYAFGADINFFLSDVFWIGVQGQYFIKAFTDREDLIGLQYNRIPTLNRYLYGAAFNLGYVPVYGKFALVNKAIIPWEIYASGGIGWTRSEIIPRNPGDLGLDQRPFDRERRGRFALLPLRLADGQLRLPRLHHGRQVRAHEPDVGHDPRSGQVERRLEAGSERDVLCRRRDVPAGTVPVQVAQVTARRFASRRPSVLVR